MSVIIRLKGLCWVVFIYIFYNIYVEGEGAD